MSQSTAPALPRILTIDLVNEPVAEYLGRTPALASGPPPLAPLDAYLLHLLLEYAGRETAALDLASLSTFGASTVALLSHPGVRSAVVREAAWPVAPARERLHAAVGRFVASREPGRADALRVATPEESPLDALADEAGGDRSPLLVLAASAFRDGPDEIATAFLDRFPNGLVAVLGVGKPGADPAAAALMGMDSGEDGTRVRFLRDGAPSLFEATLAVLFRDAEALHRVRRIDRLFATNYDFLAILRDSCLHAIERGSRSTDPRAAVRRHAAEGMPGRYHSEKALEEATHEHRALRLENERLSDRVIALSERVQALEAGAGRASVVGLALLPFRATLALGRRYRRWLAPAGGARERAARRVIGSLRRLRAG